MGKDSSLKFLNGGIIMENKKSTFDALKVVFIVVGAVVTIGTLAILAYKLFKKHFKVTFECDGENFCDDCFPEDEVLERYRLSRKSVAEGLFSLVDSELTDKFSLYELCDGARLKTGGASGVVIITEGDGELCGISVSKGDRLYFTEEAELLLVSQNGCKAVACAVFNNHIRHFVTLCKFYGYICMVFHSFVQLH